ncbi:hypothetical protein TTHERM_000136439 (macronuclear) [Tetrahymena thermophila SB210]|uniref:Kinase domain protein n=1 Tax=Tetrahymena thermophila (strain SB210) TaxID=312017 RepID=W7X2K6_TETTS|nr:hypothetical protein TTHERM_000136439 [Tetrahymena thermophila SB210]EWS73485.1 hypothetical protein TTHERM_000136439 [Tetrahymena thermophila SB210]|eukprot:XP_012653967.1 hypothetical protein TTHERM_000136439 [Tetrahymena thermophila SB210]
MQNQSNQVQGSQKQYKFDQILIRLSEMVILQDKIDYLKHLFNNQKDLKELVFDCNMQNILFTIQKETMDNRICIFSKNQPCVSQLNQKKSMNVVSSILNYLSDAQSLENLKLQFEKWNMCGEEQVSDLTEKVRDILKVCQLKQFTLNLSGWNSAPVTLIQKITSILNDLQRKKNIFYLDLDFSSWDKCTELDIIQLGDSLINISLNCPIKTLRLNFSWWWHIQETGLNFIGKTLDKLNLSQTLKDEICINLQHISKVQRNGFERLFNSFAEVKTSSFKLNMDYWQQLKDEDIIFLSQQISKFARKNSNNLKNFSLIGSNWTQVTDKGMNYLLNSIREVLEQNIKCIESFQINLSDSKIQNVETTKKVFSLLQILKQNEAINLKLFIFNISKWKMFDKESEIYKDIIQNLIQLFSNKMIILIEFKGDCVLESFMKEVKNCQIYKQKIVLQYSIIQDKLQAYRKEILWDLIKVIK